MDNTASSRRISVALGLGAAVLIVIFLLHAHSYSHYNLYGDDFAIFGGSAGNPIDWFTHGFSQYFNVYPEWFVPYTNFIRPGVNAIIRLGQICFGTHYAFYFLLFYAAQFLLIWMVVLMARQIGVQEKWLLLLAFLLAIEPAFYNAGLVGLAFQFDVWCGLFTVAAFFFLSRKLYTLALVSLILAVFTKESALYAPIAAAFTVAYGVRRKGLAAIMLLPLAFWFAARKFVLIHGSAKGIYALGPMSSPKGIVVEIVKGILYWPSGLLKDQGATSTIQLGDFVHTPSLAIFSLGNLFLWVVLLFVGYKLLHHHKAALLSPFVVYIWLCGALSFGVLVGHSPRFGGSIYPLELLLLAVAGAALPISALRTASLAALCLMVPAFLWNVYRSSAAIDLDREQNISSRFIDALRHYGNGATVIYVLNEPSWYSSPEYVTRTAGIPGRIVVLNQFEGCLRGNSGTTAFSQTGTTELKIAVQLPSCAKLAFDGVNPAILESSAGAAIARGNFAQYALPDEKVTGHSLGDAHALALDLGQELNITLEGFNPPGSLLIYYDWGSGLYRCAGEKCAGS